MIHSRFNSLRGCRHVTHHSHDLRPPSISVVMRGFQRPAPAPVRSQSMRPPPRPASAQQMSRMGRAASPADTNNSVLSNAGTKRREREFEQEEGEETNIHVVVRCRGRNEREVKENSGVVISTTGVRGQNVELSMGPNAISNKSYHFDKVFSPAADQAILFEDVVAPILDEVLAGFNCTIFAYGQTGTGKTYTMSGDMVDTLGLLSDNAGIIPRTLYSLFQKLEAEDVECSVKCSFIELYNEELRDLLSADESIKLKIYDDASRKNHAATMVQGMEESHIQNATAGIKLLQEGSFRRQVAATKCNDLSSRSHTVFSITTYIKKSTDVGDDFICAGKLNLVDLAGSENIQRSGAENKRAAEAGLINKSLLTLGRVINALVDKSQHIPYRESKLTRLLQDSLGGRTKTCIIATVSPAKSNLEETISTLDYAFRAKNIRNKPQMSMISKKRLLKEFTSEIEKLKSELIATRQRNGVYLSNEQYEEITVQSESRRILSEEQNARIETMEVSLRNKVQELFNLTNNLTTMRRDNESTRTTLDSTKDLLFKTDAVLQDTQQLLEDETALRAAHEQTEGQLKNIGTQLVATVGSTVKDLEGVHSKLRRRSALHRQNQDLWQSSVDSINQVSTAVDQHLDEFQTKQKDFATGTSDRLQTFVSQEASNLEHCKTMLLDRTNAFETAQSSVEAKVTAAQDSMNTVLEEIKVLREEVKEKVGEGLKGLNDAAARISGEVICELEQFHAELHTSYSALGKEFKNMFEDITKQLATQRAENDRLRAALQVANQKSIEASLAASNQLEACLAEERKASEQERHQLKEQIFGLIDASATRQDERLTSSVQGVQTHVVEAAEVFEQADKTFAEEMTAWGVAEEALVGQVNKSKEELKGRMKRDWTAINEKSTNIRSSTKGVHQETVKIVDAQLGEVATQMSALDEFVTKARSQNDDGHNEHLAGLLQLQSQMAQVQTDLTHAVEQRQRSLKVFGESEQSHSTEQLDLVANLDQHVRSALESLSKDFDHSGPKDYVPTGETPQKREWQYPTDLPQTAAHDSIIARRRGLPDPTIQTRTPSTARTPGRSPKKHTSPRKASPSKPTSPTKGKVYTDIADQHQSQTINVTEMLKGLKEVDINVVPQPSQTIDFSKSVGSGQPPPLKRHATAMGSGDARRAAKSRATATPGVENQSQGVGPGRKLRSSPSD